jgi:hypothetical protein
MQKFWRIITKNKPHRYMQTNPRDWSAYRKREETLSMHNSHMSEKEYIERVSNLFEKIQAESAANEKEEVLFKRYRDAEFDLMVEYRLGPNFPAERREALRSVHQQIQNQTEELRKKYLSGDLQKQEFFDLMQASTAEMAKKYATVFTQEEMTAFFGHGEGAYKLPFSSDKFE